MFGAAKQSRPQPSRPRRGDLKTSLSIVNNYFKICRLLQSIVHENVFPDGEKLSMPTALYASSKQNHFAAVLCLPSRCWK